jgi:hypothetical protein
VRVPSARGTLVQSGVRRGAPGGEPAVLLRSRAVGLNAFGIEGADGVRKHGIQHYLELACGAAAAT